MQRIFKWIFAFIVVAVVHSGCTTPNTVSLSAEEFLREKPEQELPISELAAGDTIEVSVEVDGRMEVLSHRAELNYQGMVTLPLVGDVKIVGHTLDEARGIIAETYGAYYVNPPVIMMAMANDLTSGEWGSVMVMGRVARPGRVPLRNPNGMNLTTAIQDAGGFSDSAKKSHIRISRMNESGKKIQTIVDFGEIGQGGDADADIQLIDGDIVYVPERIF